MKKLFVLIITLACLLALPACSSGVNNQEVIDMREHIDRVYSMGNLEGLWYVKDVSNRTYRALFYKTTEGNFVKTDLIKEHTITDRDNFKVSIHEVGTEDRGESLVGLDRLNLGTATIYHYGDLLNAKGFSGNEMDYAPYDGEFTAYIVSNDSNFTGAFTFVKANDGYDQDISGNGNAFDKIYKGAGAYIAYYAKNEGLSMDPVYTVKLYDKEGNLQMLDECGAVNEYVLENGLFKGQVEFGMSKANGMAIYSEGAYKQYIGRFTYDILNLEEPFDMQIEAN